MFFKNAWILGQLKEMKKINQKLLYTFTKPVCDICYEELYVFKIKANILFGDAVCINEKCSNKYISVESVELDHN